MNQEQQSHKIEKVQPSHSVRFSNMVVREFSSQVGVLQLSPYQQRLSQHMFVGIDAALKALAAKQNKDAIPIEWANVNMPKLAIDAVHRVELGLDALIQNHVHVIPYLNGKTKKYDLDLRVGYVGKDCYKRKMSLNPPTDIIYQLVYGSDEFIPMMKSHLRKVETYEFNINSPFQRGEVVGGFGYIIYENPEENKLIMVSKADFDKSKKAAQSATFWNNHPLDKIQIDPEKVNKSFLEVELGEAEEAAARQIEEGANKETLDTDPKKEQLVEIDDQGTVTVRHMDNSEYPTTFEPELDEDQKAEGKVPDF